MDPAESKNDTAVQRSKSPFHTNINPYNLNDFHHQSYYHPYHQIHPQLPSTLTNYENDLGGYSGRSEYPQDSSANNHFYPPYNNQFLPTTIPNRSWIYDNGESLNGQYGQLLTIILFIRNSI